MTTPKPSVLASPVTGRWTLDARRSRATFTVRNWGLVTVSGTVGLRSATATADPSGALTDLTVVADLTTLATGIARRDRDLAKPSLLDIGAHPTLTFRGVPGPWESDRRTGTLEVRGVDAPVELQVSIPRRTADEIDVHVTAVLDRRPLGIKAPRLLIGRWIQITVDATFVR